MIVNREFTHSKLICNRVSNRMGVPDCLMMHVVVAEVTSDVLN